MKNEEMETTYTIPVGPIHPALKEPIRLDLKVDGERIVDVDVVVGQVHRGIEWLGMNRNNPIQNIYLAERVCGICNISHPFAYVMAVEHAAGISPPERAEYIRAITAEMERIHSHLLWAGVAAHEIGFESVFYLVWRVREKIMDLIEYVTGNRVTKAMFQIGGVRRDITEEQFPRIRKTLDYYKSIFDQLKTVFLDDRTIRMRAKNVGVLKREDALKLLAVGPTARASGVAKDVRQDQAYSAYADLDIKAVTPDILTGSIVGDVYDRIIVRLLEIKQSMEIIERCLEEMPPGAILAEPKMAKVLNTLKKAEGEGVGRHEAPRGEVIHYVRLEAGRETLATWKIRAPTYVNLMSIPTILKGGQIADVPIAFASIDPCISCTNRAMVVDRKTNEKSIMTYEELHQLCVEKTRRLSNGLVK
ncbi:MAG: NADH dehydrogenase subunit [Chloroflexi bacterium CG07_land_8_20_14_0_80_45_17]|nr:MAG: NADH dehydrogenase subunit [Chloroflexi bacterium CG23_combo_of_CG06-09_8_20_14_all_45_10]PIU56700.1 MAG: NADH dehydrogenase subunit [Chloroflexi bacterium CG07_land_8_20_14_0_80_45_17]